MADFIEQLFIYIGSFGGFIFFTGLIFQSILLILLGMFIFMPMIFAYFVFKLIPIYGNMSESTIYQQYEQPKRTGKSIFGESAEGLGAVDEESDAYTKETTNNNTENDTSSTINWNEPNSGDPNQKSTRRTQQGATSKSKYRTRRERQKQRQKKRRENRKRWREYNRKNSTSASDTGNSSDHTLSKKERRQYRDELGIDKGYSQSELKSAYRGRIKETHPDTENGSEDEFKDVQEAYEELQKLF